MENKSIFSPDKIGKSVNLKANIDEIEEEKLNFDSVTLDDLKNFYKKNLVRDIETSL